MKHLWDLVKAFWRGVRAVQSVLGTLLFLFVLFIVVNTLFRDMRPLVPSGAALIVAPVGQIVERATQRTAREVLLQGDEGRVPETLMRTVAAAIKNAKTDDRIKALVLNMDFLWNAGVSQLHYMAELIDDFRESGKPVYAYGYFFSDGSYLVASHADKVYLHPEGSIFFTGYGIFTPYFKTALDKIKADVHVFRSGAYKSYGEPYLRDDMSEEAKEENRALLADLWDRFVTDVSARRGREADTFRAGFATLGEDLRAAGGDPAKLALAQGLVDGLLSEDEWVAKMSALVGTDDNPEGYRNIYLEPYARAVTGDGFFPSSKIAIVVVQGEIGFGDSQGSDSGSFTVVEQLRRARQDSRVKAVVLRVDSPGGSLIAAEQIREELERIKAAGKPVIASMGAVAASGGYWISAPADEIWADASTITGSIGVIGIFPSFDRSLDAIGIHVDGVGTTPLSGDFSPLRPLSPLAQDIFQQSVDASYRSFVEMVAGYRNLPPEDVDALGQGRVWSGQAAYGFKLVDHLGNLDGAIAAAASRAQLTDYDFVYLEKAPDFSQSFAQFLFAVTGRTNAAVKAPRGNLEGFFLHLKQAVEAVVNLNDPKGVYLLCEACEVR
jgi:protease IV